MLLLWRRWQQRGEEGVQRVVQRQREAGKAEGQRMRQQQTVIVRQAGQHEQRRQRQVLTYLRGEVGRRMAPG